MNPFLPAMALGAVLLLQGCATYNRKGVTPETAAALEQKLVANNQLPSLPIQEHILALNPEHLSEQDVRQLLSQGPAPHIVNIHGGIYPVHRRMNSFSEFLIGMGYPGHSITNAGDGTSTFSCYESSDKIAGVIAWYYSKTGLRPMMFGHSQGGMQNIKVLRKFAGLSTKTLHLWNPYTWQKENRTEFIDPISGRVQPVVGITLPYVSSVGAGGLTRLLPNQWDMCMKLRDIPNSVEEFTGFCKTKDLLGGDFLGYGPANHFKPLDKAAVRNVWLPSSYRHGAIPDTRHLLADLKIIDWINRYHPSDKPVDRPKLDATFDLESKHILWAAEVWFHIKKHWVLELQRVIRATQTPPAAATLHPGIPQNSAFSS